MFIKYSMRLQNHTSSHATLLHIYSPLLTLPAREYVTTKLQKQFLTGALVAATPLYINNYRITRGDCEVKSVWGVFLSQNTSTESGLCDQDLT